MKKSDYKAIWEKKNPEKVSAYKKKWAEKNKDKIRAKDKKYRNNNPDKVRLWDKNRKIRIRNKVLSYYGGVPPKCACCGEMEIKFLSLDHINNDGAKHRREIKSKGNNLYRWIVKNKFPSIFQILCYNCNCAKGFYGKCPHAES